MDRTLKAIGGPLHGQEVTLPQDRNSYVDLASGTCYIARELLQQLPDGARLAREVAMHETVVGDDQMTQMALIDAVMTAFFKEGRVVDAPPAVASPSLSPGPKGERTTGSGLLIP